MSYVRANKVRARLLFLDVEQRSRFWSSNQATNRAWFESWVRTFQSGGFRNLGLYSSRAQWCDIMGCDYAFARQQSLP